MTIDPIDSMIFVANSGSGTVSAIYGVEDRVLANTSVGKTHKRELGKCRDSRLRYKILESIEGFV